MTFAVQPETRATNRYANFVRLPGGDISVRRHEDRVVIRASYESGAVAAGFSLTLHDARQLQDALAQEVPDEEGRIDIDVDDDHPLTLSMLDPGGVYNSDGELIGRIPCGCEDYPCCGH